MALLPSQLRVRLARTLLLVRRFEHGMYPERARRTLSGQPYYPWGSAGVPTEGTLKGPGGLCPASRTTHRVPTEGTLNWPWSVHGKHPVHLVQSPDNPSNPGLIDPVKAPKRDTVLRFSRGSEKRPRKHDSGYPRGTKFFDLDKALYQSTEDLFGALSMCPGRYRTHPGASLSLHNSCLFGAFGPGMRFSSSSRAAARLSSVVQGRVGVHRQ